MEFESMLGKALWERWPKCPDKASYSAQELANQVAARRMREGSKELRTYHCKKCLLFHITSQPLLQQTRYADQPEVHYESNLVSPPVSGE